MVIFPGCKINIGLNIIEKRADGYHNLESVFYPISLSDILEIIPDETFSISFSGIPIAGNPTSNLVVRAYHLLQTDYQFPPVKIHLHKIVPMGAGLGGGSADGAATLVALNSLFDLRISTEKLMDYAKQLGSDCPFFIHSKAAFVTGTGEYLEPLGLTLSPFYIQLYNPGIHVNTKMAFSGIHPKESGIDLKEWIKKNPTEWKDAIKNDFEDSVFTQFDSIRKIKAQLYSNGALYACMTGTGSTVYGIFRERPISLLKNESYSTGFEWIEKL